MLDPSDTASSAPLTIDREQDVAGAFVGIVPAAGLGSRLRPLRAPKELLPILYAESADGAGLRPIPVAELALAALRLAGIRRCFVIVSDAKPEIARYLGDGRERDMALAYVMQDAPDGLADAVDRAFPWIRDRFSCLALPDAVFQPPTAIDSVCRHLLETDADLVLGLFPVPNAHELGAVRLDGQGVVVEILEKPAETDLTLAWGVAAWSPAFTEFLHERLHRDGPSAHPSITTLFEQARREGLATRAVTFESGAFFDVGTPVGIKRLMRTWSPDTETSDAPSPAEDVLAAAVRHRLAGELAAADRILAGLQQDHPADAALRALRVALARDRHDPDAARQRALGGDVAAPDPSLIEAFGGAAPLAEALSVVAADLQRRGEQAAAARLWRCVLSIEPGWSAAHCGLSQGALDAGRLDQALAEAWQAVAHAPRSAAALTQLGRVLAACGHDEDARERLVEAVTLDHESVDAHHELGRLSARCGRTADAEEHLQRAIMLGVTRVAAMRDLGWLLHDTERLERAQTVAELAVRMGPGDALAHHLLGWVLHRRGRDREARAALERAVSIAPDFTLAIRILAELEIAAGEVTAAEARLRDAVARAPDDPALRRTFAWALLDMKALEAATAEARRAVALNGDDPAAAALLASILLARNKLHAAAGICIDLLARHPDHAEGYRLMGEVEVSRRRFDAAEQWFRKAIARDAGSAIAHARLAFVCLRSARLDEAQRALESAIDANPGFLPAYHDLALVRQRQERFAEAELLLRALLDRAPNDARSWLEYGRFLENAQRDTEAASALARALALDPSLDAAFLLLLRLWVRGIEPARAALASCSPGTLRKGLADLINDAIAYIGFDEYRRIVAHARAAFPDDDLFEAAHQFGHSYDIGQSLASIRTEADRFGAADRPRTIARRRTAGRPRIAYVGNFLHRELMGHVEHHDHERFEFFLFSNDDAGKLTRPDPRLTILRPEHVDVAAACAALEIDLLVDVIGPYPREGLLDLYRKTRERIAPIQCLWLNTFHTSGSPAYDYVIADPVFIRPGEERWYSEQVLRLPHCEWNWSPPLRSLEPGPLPARSNGFVTFGSANRGIKLNDVVLGLWASVLARLPGSRLRLMCWHTDHWPLRRRIVETFGAHGVSADRIDFVPPAAMDRVQPFYQSIDLSLDTIPFNGGLTTFESLWMGVPIITLVGDTFTSRQSESILRTLGRPEWVAPDRATFVDHAVAIARDLDRVAGARVTLREEMERSPIRDTRRFARDLEAQFAVMLESR